MEFALNCPDGLMTPTEAGLWWEFCMSPRSPHDPPRILFDEESDRRAALNAAQPSFFVDLNLDQVVAAITADWAEYELMPFLHSPLHRVEAIQYRHEVFRDLEDAALFAHVETFAHRMRDVRVYVALANKLYYRFHKEGWFLCAVETYCQAVKEFTDALTKAPIRSRGLLAFRDYFASYIESDRFTSLLQEANELAADLSKVKYSVLIRDNSFTVRGYDEEADYSAEIEETFRKFQLRAAKDYRVKYRYAPEDMNHIEAKILEFVARQNPELFSRLVEYCARYAAFIDETILVFDREIHFYIAYLRHIARFKEAGLAFNYPKISADSKSVRASEAFDLALAQKLAAENKPIVSNDFFLEDRERIIVVTGPNQGGKTTFARMFGQLHYLASLGCPVPGRQSQLYLFDRLFTHFEREEKVESHRGKLEDDLVRVHAILREATPRSIVVMNEVFTSTTVQDELFLSRKIMERLNKLDVLCVWVTFLDELASSSDKTVSMVSTIVPENPTLRTFKIVRRPADGRAYAMAIAEKYRLTHDRIKERIRP
jgi:DNA mismatch repair protein MutS